jgi:hypothetical protein
LIENQLFVGPPTGACDMKSPPPFNFLFTYLFSITFLYCLLSFYFIKHVYIHTIEW